MKKKYSFPEENSESNIGSGQNDEVREPALKSGYRKKTEIQEIYIEPDVDLNRAISMEQFKEEAKEHIKQLYKQGNK